LSPGNKLKGENNFIFRSNVTLSYVCLFTLELMFLDLFHFYHLKNSQIMWQKVNETILASCLYWEQSFCLLLTRTKVIIVLLGLSMFLSILHSLFSLSSLFFWCHWDLNSGLPTCKASTPLLEPHFQSILLWLFCRCCSRNSLPGLAGMSHWYLAIFLSLYRRH
jgi:hypothetical protein